MNLLRWILVLPGALFFGFISTFPLHWALYLIFSPNNEESDLGSLRFFAELFSNEINIKAIEYMIYPAVIAATFIIAGYKIAPKYKFKTAVALFGLYVVIWSILLLFGYWPEGSISTRTFLAIVGAIIGLFGAKIGEKEEQID